jgi:hypothetical protein
VVAFFRLTMLPSAVGDLNSSAGNLLSSGTRTPYTDSRFFTPRLQFQPLDELNAWLLDKWIAYAKAHQHPELPEQTISKVFEAERPKLVTYAGRFDGTRIWMEQYARDSQLT